MSESVVRHVSNRTLMALLSYTAAKTRVFVASGLKFAVNSRNLVDMTPIQRYEQDLQAELAVGPKLVPHATLD